MLTEHEERQDAAISYCVGLEMSLQTQARCSTADDLNNNGRKGSDQQENS